MANFLFGDNIDEQTFYNKTELEELYITFKNEDLEKFRDFMSKLLNRDLVIQNIESSKMTISVDKFRNDVMLAILRASYEYHTTKFMDILINEYGLILTDEFVAASIYNYRVDSNIFAALHKYADVKKHIAVVKFYFNGKCYRKNADSIRNFLDLGYSIRELCESDSIYYSELPVFSAVANNDTSVLLFLLQQNVDIKKYETDLVRYCVYHSRYKHLKILIEYGVDLQVLTRINISEINQDAQKINELLVQNNIDPIYITIALTVQKMRIARPK